MVLKNSLFCIVSLCCISQLRADVFFNTSVRQKMTPEQKLQIYPNEIAREVEIERLARQFTEELAFSLNYYTLQRNLRAEVEQSFTKLQNALLHYVTTIYHEQKYELAKTTYYYIKERLLVLKYAVNETFELLDQELINQSIWADKESRSLGHKQRLINQLKQNARVKIKALNNAILSLVRQVKNMPIP